MSNAISNADRVRAIYAAFGRQDIPAILEQLSEQIEWEYGIAPNPVPWLQPRQGRTGAAAFFATLGALEFHAFNPHTILHDGAGVVVALVDLEATVKATGRRIRETDEVHIWRFDERGRAVRFRHCVDTAQHIAAFTGRPG